MKKISKSKNQVLLTLAVGGTYNTRYFRRGVGVVFRIVDTVRYGMGCTSIGTKPNFLRK